MEQINLNDQLYQTIRDEAEQLGHPVSSLRGRAKGYLTVYHYSGGICSFALVAAHGALWASWYLVCAKLAAMVLACIDVTSRLSPRQKYLQFTNYVNALKEINQSVMIETYVLIHTIKRIGPDYAIQQGLPETLVSGYVTALSNTACETADLRDLYHQHFTWEQDRVVSTKLNDAFAKFSWPLMRKICQRPWVWFSYFKVGRSMNFREFTNKDERIEKGLIAFDRAKDFGFQRLAKASAIRLAILPGLRSRQNPKLRLPN